MKIKFVNHAGFIIEHQGVSLISDPWMEGKVFNNGWDLVSKTKLTYEDFKTIDYIWFSHEHPDHFSPPNIKKIPAEYRSRITVLFQNTIDGRVAEFCKKAGFRKVVSLQKGQRFEVGPDFSILCEYFDEGDSWIHYQAGGVSVLNTNDCAIKNLSQISYIKKQVGEIDLLMTQFSYAFWVGNKNDIEFRKNVAAEKLEWMKFQVDNFAPKITIPIASFIYFCHEENFYLNDSVNTAETTYTFLKNKTATTPVVLYNGDEYTYPETWDSQKSIERYKQDYIAIASYRNTLVKNKPVELSELYAAAATFIDNLNRTNNLIVKSVLKEARIFLIDYQKSFSLSLKEKLKEVTLDYRECDVALSSESLLFCLKFPYGTDTTQINGRLQKPENGNYTRFYNLFRIDQQKSRGQEMSVSYLLAAGVRKVLKKLGLKKF